MKTFNIVVPIQASYSYDVQANTLEEALEMIASGEVDDNGLNCGDIYLDEAVAYEVTANGVIKL